MIEKDNLEIKKIYNHFLSEMNEWEKKCNTIAEKGELTAEDKFLNKKKELINIFDNFCTTKDRKNGKPNTVSYGNEEHYHYDLSKETIEKIESDEKNPKKAYVHTFREDPLDEKFIYVFFKKKDRWLIDSKKRYSSWKKKWENVSL